MKYIGLNLSRSIMKLDPAHDRLW